MDALASSIIYFSIFVSALMVTMAWREAVLLSPKDKSPSLQLNGHEFKTLGLWAIPFLMLYGIAFSNKLAVADSILPFLAGLLLPGFLSGIRGLSAVRTLGLFWTTVFLTFHLTESSDISSSYPLAAITSGLLVYRLKELITKPNSPQASTAFSWEEMTPTLIWLVGNAWIYLQTLSIATEIQQGFLLGVTMLALLLQRLPVYFHWPLWQNPILKTLILVTLGGIGAIFINRNLLMAPSAMTLWPCLFGGGILWATLLETIPLETKDSSDAHGASIVSGLMVLLWVGIATLVASRIFGTFGWTILALSCLTKINSKSKWISYVTLFLLGRSLVQGFTQEFNLNVSGINLTHTYVSAALYGGMVFMMLLPRMITTWGSSSQTTLLFWTLGLFIPLAGNFFLHVEAMGSFFIAALTTALTVSVLSETKTLWSMRASQNFLGLTLLMMTVATLGSEILEWGKFATRAEQIKTLLACLLFVGILGGLTVKYLPKSFFQGKEALQ